MVKNKTKGLYSSSKQPYFFGYFKRFYRTVNIYNYDLSVSASSPVSGSKSARFYSSTFIIGSNKISWIR